MFVCGVLCMKVINRKIDIVTYFDEKGIHPVRFRLQNEETKNIYKIEKVLLEYEEKFQGRIQKVYRCQGKIKANLRVYELKYDTKECFWYLFKV